MGNRTAKFISALIGSVIAGAPLAAVSQNAPTPASTANTASDCLASPKGVAPRGQHWHYRVERGTKRQCWYLRAEGSKDSATRVQTAQTATDTPTADSPAPQQHAVQDAHAEYLATQSAAAPNMPTAPTQTAATTPAQQPASPTADSNTEQPAATLWPDPSTAAAPPSPQSAPAAVAAAAQPNTKPSKSTAPIALAAADSTDKPTGSIQMLLLVVGGALALAGVLASIIYRFAGGRARAQAGDHRRVKWDNREPQDHDSRAPWLKTDLASAPGARWSRPIDFDAAPPQSAQRATFTKTIGRIAAQSASARVEAAEPDPTVVIVRSEATKQSRFSMRKQAGLLPSSMPVPTRNGEDEAEIAVFNGQFEIEAATPRLAADDAHKEELAKRDEDVHVDENTHVDDTVDIDVITAMLERLAKEGPRLTQPSLEAVPADHARSQRGQSAARA